MPTTHVLARAVIRDNGHVLVVQANGQSHTFLPGGHHEADEGLVLCLRRELREELGVQASVGRYLGAVEHRWSHKNEVHYEVNHCFAVEAPSLSSDTRPFPREEHLTFAWVPMEGLDNVALQPPPLRVLLRDSPSDSTPWWASTVNSASKVWERGDLTTEA